jgi:hypothetical protein
MKKIFTLLFLAGSVFCSFAQTSGTKIKDGQALPAPKNDGALYLNETEYDFGKIPQGKPVTHDFIFKNTGTTPFALENVQASCGCTTPDWPKDTISAGQTSKIKVGYNAAAEGTFNKTVTITYAGGVSKQIVIKGEVWKTPVSSAPVNPALETLKNQQ